MLKFRSITVDSSNLHFASSDGVIFTKNFETLLSFPRRHRLSSYAIPSSVTSIGNKAFSGSSNLQSIVVESKNSNYVSKDHILFTKNLKNLVCFPSKHHFSTYKIPKFVTSIGNSAFF